jgi:peptidoglycan/xylan/chitin deacetylase (PgdA/CDA1 family)
MNHAYPWYQDTSYPNDVNGYNQLTDQIKLVSEFTDQALNLWRAPGGYNLWENELPSPYNSQFYRYAWDIDAQDIYDNLGDAKLLYQEYLNGITTVDKKSVIILMHGWTPEALDLIIPDLIERNYKFDVLPRPCDPIGPIIGHKGGVIVE